MARTELGLSRREMERELAWLIRNPPEDPRDLARLMASAVVSLIARNNERIAGELGHPREDADQERF